MRDRLAQLVANWATGSRGASDKHCPRPAVIRPLRASGARHALDTDPDLPRHLGQHSADVIAAGRLDDWCRSSRDDAGPGRRPVDKTIARARHREGRSPRLGMMSVLQDSLTLVREMAVGRSGAAAAGRSRVYRSLQEADTIGVFQSRPRPDGDAPARPPDGSTTSSCRSRSSAPADRGRHGASLHPAPARPRARDVSAPEPRAILRRTLGVPLFQEHHRNLQECS